MTGLGPYALLLVDCIVSNLAFSANEESAIYAMLILGHYHKLKILLYSSIGICASIIVNYSSGMVFYKLLSRVDKGKDKIELRYKHTRFMMFFKSYNSAICLLILVPFFGKFIPFLGGFLSLRLDRVLSWCVTAKVSHYIYIILSYS